MHTNASRDTFFILINLIHRRNHQKQHSRKTSKTKNLKTKPKSHAHSKKPRNQKIKTANRILTLLTSSQNAPLEQATGSKWKDL